jgi:pimeloyl-ACP methyl ester carboxylesterase
MGRGWLAGAALCGGALGAALLVNHRRERRALRRNPPAGHVLRLGRVRLHVHVAGSGPDIVLLHGNSSMVPDFLASPLHSMLTEQRRVWTFDRPGFGHSNRPEGTVWTADAQADLILGAMDRLGIRQAEVLGHSWGCLVAIAMASRAPGVITGLHLLSGYYHPPERPSQLAFAPAALPVLGPLIRHTVLPLAVRPFLRRILRKMFRPTDVSHRFRRAMDRDMLLRPPHVQATAEDSTLMMREALRQSHAARHLNQPVTIIVGEEDSVIDWRRQSARLHRALPGSRLLVVPGAGHMVHHSAPDLVGAEVLRGTSR